MTVLYQSPIFGPIKSRRLGISLGVNLLPEDGKCCSFDCIYCECGFNRDRVPHHRMPSRQDVVTALRQRLQEMQAVGPTPDVITFAGNGEPTMNPEFPAIISDVAALRDEYFPQARISVLTNSTEILRDEVFEALKLVDNNILKLDTVNPDYIRLVDRPISRAYDVRLLIERMKQFGNQCKIQTMFMDGEFEGVSVANYSEQFVQPWLEAVKEINPSEVMIYTVDRETPAPHLLKAAPEILDAIAVKVRQLNIPCQVSY